MNINTQEHRLITTKYAYGRKLSSHSYWPISTKAQRSSTYVEFADV